MALPLLLLGGGSLALVGGLLRSSGGDLDGEAVGDSIATALEAGFDALPPVMASFSVGVVDGVAESAEAVREALRGRETGVMAGITMLFIAYATFRSVKAMTGGASS